MQYDKDLLEVWDEAKRLRCEWFNDYEKTASKPPMVIADLDVIQLDFRGECQRTHTHPFCMCALIKATIPYTHSYAFIQSEIIPCAQWEHLLSGEHDDL